MMAATDKTHVQVVSVPRFTPSLLQRNPVHLLLVKRGSQSLPTSTLGAAGEPWEALIDATPPANRPKFVIEAWKGSAALWRGGPAEKGYAIRWEKRGYSSHIKSLNACAIGGALDQNRLLIVRARGLGLDMEGPTDVGQGPPDEQPVGTNGAGLQNASLSLTETPRHRAGPSLT